MPRRSLGFWTPYSSDLICTLRVSRGPPGWCSPPNISTPNERNAWALRQTVNESQSTHGAVCATALLTICPDAMYRTQPFGVVENLVVTQDLRAGSAFAPMACGTESAKVAAVTLSLYCIEDKIKYSLK